MATKKKAANKSAKKAAGRTTAAAFAASGLSKAEAEKALDAATKAIKSLQKKSDANAWQIGRKLNAVAELGLHTAKGFHDVGDYAVTLGLSHGSAFSYMRVASAFSEEIAATFGSNKLDRALAYIAATPEDETARDIPTLKVRVVGADGTVQQKPFAKTSTRELQAAAAHERKVAGKKPRKASTITPAVTQGLARANAALDRAVGKSNAALADVAVRTHDGEVLIDVRGIPFGDLQKALTAVAKAFR
jgi:hypothetical protein